MKLYKVKNDRFKKGMNCMKKNLIISIALILFFITQFAGSAPTDTQGLVADLMLPVEVSNLDYLTLREKGYGTSIEKAIDNALKNAVYFAVGIVMRSYTSLDSNLNSVITEASNTTVFNERVKEEIVAYANTYIHDYEVLEILEKNNHYTVDIKAYIKFHPLDKSIILTLSGTQELDVSKLLKLWEINRKIQLSSGKMVYQILKDFMFPKEVFHYSKKISDPYEDMSIEELESDIEFLTTQLDLEIRSNDEKYQGMKMQLKNLLDKACEKKVEEKVPFTQYGMWHTVYQHNLSGDRSKEAVLRIFEKTEEDSIIFTSYFFNLEKRSEKYIFDYLEKYDKDFNDYKIILTLKDIYNKTLFSKELNISEYGFSLRNDTMGFIFSYEKPYPCQCIIYPGTLLLQTGKIKMSTEMLDMKEDIKLLKEKFESISKIKLEIH